MASGLGHTQHGCFLLLLCALHQGDVSRRSYRRQQATGAVAGAANSSRRFTSGDNLFGSLPTALHSTSAKAHWAFGCLGCGDQVKVVRGQLSVVSGTDLLPLARMGSNRVKINN